MDIDFSKIRPQDFNQIVFAKGRKVAQRVESGSGNFVVEICPICQSEKRHFFMEKYEIPIFQCDNCELKYAGFHPKNFEDVYSDESYLNQTLKAYDDS